MSSWSIRELSALLWRRGSGSYRVDTLHLRHKAMHVLNILRSESEYLASCSSHIYSSGTPSCVHWSLGELRNRSVNRSSSKSLDGGSARRKVSVVKS
jgi:hypothetical protein